jgi:hypothetical protein
MDIHNSNTRHNTDIIVPQYAGAYMINNNASFNLTKKPNAFHRFFTKLLLGWKWQDSISTKYPTHEK